MTEFEIVSGSGVDRSTLEQFLKEVYPLPKSEFILEHGEWLYRGSQNQWMVIKDEQIVAYCAVIPTACAIGGRPVPALWWVDLIVAPDFRGQGIQTRIDEKMRRATDLKLGFPNELAAKIHGKHKWGVREDGHVHMLPLRPHKVRAVHRASGWRGAGLKTAAIMLAPLTWIMGAYFRRYRPKRARKLGKVDAELLSDIFERTKDKSPVTTYRDADFICWRYLDAPYRRQLVFYVGGPAPAPTLCLIGRYVNSQGLPALRILDLFGDIKDMEGLSDILRLAVRDAARAGVGQVTAMSFLPRLSSFLRHHGFLLSATARFCWHGSTPSLHEALKGPQHWTLGDSDNDTPY